MKWLAFVVVSSCVAAPAVADPGSLAIRLGQQITLHLDEMGSLREVGAPVPVDAVPADERTAEMLQARPEAKSRETLTQAQLQSPIWPMRIDVDFRRTAAGTSMLRLRNGYGRSVSYHATMRVGARSASTTVCTVIAGSGSVESWPYEIDELTLDGFAFLPFGVLPTCD